MDKDFNDEGQKFNVKARNKNKIYQNDNILLDPPSFVFSFLKELQLKWLGENKLR
jgi:hypothetical protein